MNIARKRAKHFAINGEMLPLHHSLFSLSLQRFPPHPSSPLSKVLTGEDQSPPYSQYWYYLCNMHSTSHCLTLCVPTNVVNYTITYARQHAYANMRFLVAGLLIMILSSLLAVVTLGIGAIILSYAYSMVPYLLHDYPELTPREAMKISREMMRGQKWNLFVLDLTFFGWILLVFCTAGVGMLFVQPYMLTARAAFYEDLKSEKLIEETDETTTTTAE